jgi:hypothetical protein
VTITIPSGSTTAYAGVLVFFPFDGFEVLGECEGRETADQYYQGCLHFLGRNAYAVQDRGEQANSSSKNAVSIVRSIGGYKPPFPIPKTQSAIHLDAQ